MNTQCLIIGAGLSGLVAGYLLKERGIDDFIILEKEQTPGGLCRTTRHRDYLYDYAGHFLHLDTDWVKDLIHSLLGDNLSSVSRNSKIYTKGTICRYPFQNNLYGLHPDIIGECILEYFTAYTQYGLPKSSNNYDSFGQWIDETLGVGIGRHFMHPYNRKLWTTDTYDLTTEWMKNYVPKTTLKDIVTGALQDVGDLVGYNARFLYPMHGGIGALIKSLELTLQGHIHCGEEVTRVDRGFFSAHTEKNTYTYKNIINTGSLKAFAMLLHPVSTEVQEASGRLRANNVLNINFAHTGSDMGGISWMYTPDDDIPFFRLGYYSNIASTMAPDGVHSTYLEIAYEGTIDSTAMVNKSIEALCKMGIITSKNDICDTCIHDIKSAYVIYDKHYHESRSRVFSYLQDNGIFSIGRYGSWEYADMEDSFTQAKNTIETLFP